MTIKKVGSHYEASYQGYSVNGFGQTHFEAIKNMLSLINYWNNLYK